MEIEGIKMETHQNWIKQSKIRSGKRPEVAGGGGPRWWRWWCFVEDDFLRDEEDNDLFLGFSIQNLKIERRRRLRFKDDERKKNQRERV